MNQGIVGQCARLVSSVAASFVIALSQLFQSVVFICRALASVAIVRRQVRQKLDQLSQRAS